MITIVFLIFFLRFLGCLTGSGLGSIIFKREKNNASSCASKIRFGAGCASRWALVRALVRAGMHGECAGGGDNASIHATAHIQPPR